MYALVFYIPCEHFSEVIKAVFSAGAGRIGTYSGCCWYTKGVGMYTPQIGSTPAIGQVEEDVSGEEYRCEVMFSDDIIDSVLAALKLAHPYEQPVYQVTKLEVWPS